MPFAGYKDFADCVAKNQDKSDPNAYCGSIKHQVEDAYRHADFKKIYQQFLKHIQDENEAITRYNTWVTTLNLDESQPYGLSRREQFNWIRRHANFQLWKQDADAKYWKVEAGFPLESMNKNVYNIHELELSARTLQGQTPNLNHKYLMKPVEIVGSEFEDGVVECVLRVPNEYHCPGCQKGKTLNEVIQEELIVNVSLEASCDYTPTETGACEGMHFTGLALLTKDVLPGIPLTRIMPLEHIMVEALQVDDTKTKRRGKHLKVKTIVTEAKEQDDIKPGSQYCQDHPDDPRCKEHKAKIHGEQATDAPADCGEGKIWDPKQGKCVSTGEHTEQVTTPPDLTKPLSTGQRDIGIGAVEPDEHGQCPDGYILNDTLGKCVRDESCPENQHFDHKAQQCVPDDVPKPETPETAVGTSLAPAEQLVTVDTTPGEAPYERPMPKTEPTPPSPPSTKPSQMPEPAQPAPEAEPLGDLTPSKTPPLQPPEPETEKPKPPHVCVDGQHYDPTVNQCVPDEELAEMVRRIKAEAALVQNEKGRKAFEQFYIDKVTALRKHDDRLLKEYFGMKEYASKIQGAYERAISNLSIAQHNEKVWKEKRDEASGQRDDWQRKAEQYRHELETVKSKYHNALATNLELSKDNTKANEDYLTLASETEQLKEALKKSKVLSKKQLKIRVT